MAATKRGLGEKKLGQKGKGISALIPGADDYTLKAKPEEITKVDINKVEPNKNQPRKYFDEDTLNELSESIKQKGVINPLLVRDMGDYYEIVGGERRWRAAKLAGLNEIPILVKELSDKEAAEIGLIDNLQRDELNPIDEAMAFKRLIDEFGFRQDDVAQSVSKSRVAITNKLRLLKLPGRVQEMLVEGMITSGHARTILSLPENEDPIAFAERIFDERMSVREAEKEVKNLNKPKLIKKSQKLPSQLDAVYADLTEKLKTSLGTKVKINAKNDQKGSIEIEYYSKEQLAEIIDKLEA